MSMTKFVVISVNENPQYLFYLPLTIWAWRKFGWTPIVMCSGPQGIHFLAAIKHSLNPDMWRVGPIDGYGTDTTAQVSRLYAACLYGPDNDYLMTSDVDMLPLSDYWKFDPEKITVWGHDLTGFQHMPICYIGMKRTRWIEVMGLYSHRYNELIKRDLDDMPNAKSSDSVKRWVVDQDLITDRINSVTFEKDFVARGTLPNGYPVGRVDRSAWIMEHPQMIDCHMLRDIYSNPDHLAKTMLLLYKVWPDEDFTWFTDYVKEFNILCK